MGSHRRLGVSLRRGRGDLLVERAGIEVGVAVVKPGQDVRRQGGCHLLALFTDDAVHLRLQPRELAREVGKEAGVVAYARSSFFIAATAWWAAPRSHSRSVSRSSL